MMMKNKTPEVGAKILKTSLALMALSAEIIDDITGISSLSGYRGIRIFARKANMGEYEFKSAIQSLERSGFVKKTEQGFLITPKGRKRLRIEKTPNPIFSIREWDGKWRVVIFDIPERLRGRRNIFRSYLLRNDFIRLQNSVFISPFSDFDELDMVRHDCGVEKYVNFFIANSVGQDDDTLLKKKFNL